MNTKKHKFSKASSGFSLIEVLIVIAVIGVMSALVISAFTGVSRDTRKVIARQQQASVQGAVNAWVNKRSSELGSGIIQARTEYNAAEDSRARLILVGGDYQSDPIVSGYLDEKTMEHFLSQTTNPNQILSQALRANNQYIVLPDWEVGVGLFPKVEIP